MLVELVREQEVRVPLKHIWGIGTGRDEPEIPATPERKARIRAHARRIRAELRRLGRYGA